LSATIDRSRRGLLFGRIASPAEPPPPRPPWSKPEREFLAECSRCLDCVQACPEQVLVRGDGGYPEIDFGRGECTFCQACVQACPAPVFLDPAASKPWNYVASVSDACLGYQGIYCRSCGESCEAGAIRFSLTGLRIPLPSVDAEACSGCGACVAGCPAQAVRVAPVEQRA